MSHASLDTASEHVGYINKVTAARLLKQAFSCMATCIIICWSSSLVMRLGIKSVCRDLLFTSSLNPYTYHHQKLALESRGFCRTPAYLVTLLHSNNTKDVKELMAYMRGYHFVLISKICAYFQGQCLRKRECAYFYETYLFLSPVFIFEVLAKKIHSADVKAFFYILVFADF